MDTDYKLIHAVDPTKIKVNIKDKFAKLTLSSNKKKKEESYAGNVRDLEACKRISRNLLEDLQKAEDCEQKKESCYVNPLLRSDSTSDCDSTQHNKTQDDVELSFDMEPLRVTSLTQENESESRQSNHQRFNEVAELLSEQVSCLSLNSKVITVSSDSRKQEAVPHPHPQQINLNNPPEVSICISTSTEEESDDAITISDSSESNESKDYDLVTSNIPQSGETANALLPSTISNDKADLIEAFLRDVSQARREKLLSDVESVEFNLQQEQNSRKEVRNLAAADTESMSADILSDFNREVKEEQSSSELDDTEAMSETHASIFQSNDEQANLHSSPATSDNQEKHRGRELAADDTIPNTELEAHVIQRPIADADTIPNTDFDAEINYSIESVKNLVDLADTISNSNESLPIIDDSLIGNAKYDDSLESTHISPLPEESITILETTSEDEEDVSGGRVSSPHSASPVTTKSSKQSMTPDIQSEDSSVIQHHQNMPSINISAKINIKIHISEIASSNGDDEDNEDDDNDDDNDESESDQNNDESPPLPDAQRNQSTEDDHVSEAQSLSDTQQSFRPVNENDSSARNQSAAASEQSAATSDQSAIEIHSEKLAIDSPSARPSPPAEPIEQEEAGFMEHAQKLLNQLYGNAWQTPEVIRTLHRTRFEPQQQKKPELGGGAKLNTVKSPTETKPINQTAEESVLDDFSIFRRNIKTNLDSTRRVEQPTPLRVRVKNLKPRNINSEKRTRRSPLVSQNQRRVPQTEVKKRSQKGGQFNERWRQLVDDDDESDGANASDDEAPDKTIDAASDDDDDDEKNNDKSWSKNSSSSSSSDDDDDDFTKRRQQRTTRRNVTPRVAPKGKQNTNKRKDKNQLIYMDLSKQEVEIVEGTPVASNEEQLQQSLRHILNSNKYEEPPKLEATPMSTKTRRKLFTAHFGNEIGNVDCETPKAIPVDSPVDGKQTPQADKENVHLSCQPMPAIFTPFNKKLESVRTGTPIFKIQTPKSTAKNTATRKEGTKNTKDTDTNSETPKDKYGFLKSLDVCVGKSLCHPDALQYRDNYRQKKEELGKRLYDLYNEKLFDNKLQVPLVWNKKLINTAGRCLNKKKLSVRTSVVELSEKVLTSADRLRCTLIHELCHAATWIFHGEGGHGATWKSWAHKANSVFPEIPKIGVCHQYDIEYKYTYKCTLCAAKSHAHSKSKKVENIRCSYCHGAIEIFLNKKDKEGNIIPTPVREPTGFAKFVKDKYKEYKNPSLKHTDVMKILSNEFALLKVTKGN